MKQQELVQKVRDASFLSDEEKRQTVYYLTDEDYINERHAIIFLVETLLAKASPTN